MKKILMLACCIVLFINISLAQEKRFVESGVIEYEKRLNMYALATKAANGDKDVSSQLDVYKASHPQFLVLKSVLTFNKSQSLFAPVAEKERRDGVFNSEVTFQHSIVYTDLQNKRSISQKSVFEHVFLVKDSVRKIKWKLTDETREIAGYTCRRANAIIMDSVYVVAFYTNQIIVPGGPESFTGLPGMILGIALPHENITWFATKVSIPDVGTENNIAPPDKGDPVDNAIFKTRIENVLKDSGNEKASYLKAFEL